MENVAYLEVDDINSDGSLKPHVGNGKPVVLMGGAGYCGYCTKAKPALQRLAQSYPDIVVATIVSDGSAKEKAAGEFFPKWDSGYRGIPAYFGFSADGMNKIFPKS